MTKRSINNTPPRGPALPEPVRIPAIEKGYLALLDRCPLNTSGPTGLEQTRQQILDVIVEAWCDYAPTPPEARLLPPPYSPEQLAEASRLTPPERATVRRTANLIVMGHPAGVIRNLAEAARLDSSQPVDRRESCVLNAIRGLIRWGYEQGRQPSQSRSAPSPR